MLWIIGGPTSVGKSTFIQSPVCSQVTGFSCTTNVVWPRTNVELTDFAETDAVYHYNILRPWHAEQRSAGRIGGPRPGRPASGSAFRDDPAWRKLMAAPVPKRAIVLVVSQAMLEDRIQNRLINERSEIKGGVEQAYKGDRWLDLLHQLDLVAIYREWMAELRHQAIPFDCLLSDGSTYARIDDAQVPMTIAAVPASTEEHPHHG